MSDVVIHVDRLWKKYRLGVVGTGTLRHDLSRWWHRIRGKEDPYATVGNGSPPLASSTPSTPLTFSRLGDDEIWALRDVSFEVRRGEILGIIGSNGAGKSTLLKILSRVTAPTTGHVKIRGRVASLLEVGTGFHPELTGRENIYLNGAILGMRRTEIDRKLDEIVDFSGVEHFIDTPVKRYSSGMYVRLAFAVAANLDPDILIIDEVLAVGDAAFQKKCVGRMGEVAQGGRTVLFVSHNLTVVSSLCSRAILLEGGVQRLDGPTEQVVSTYIHAAAPAVGEVSWDPSDRSASGRRLRLVKARILCGDKVTGNVEIDKPTTVQYAFEVLQDGLNISSSIHLYDKRGTCVLASGTASKVLSHGFYQHSCIFPANFLNDGNYSLSIILLVDVTRQDIFARDAISFCVNEIKGREEYLGTMIGCIRPHLQWEERPLQEVSGFV